jgi:outer membrane protein
MKINKILVLICLFSCQFVVAQNNEMLPQLIKQALEYSPKIKEQQQLLSAGDYRIKVQESGLKPQVNGEVGYYRLDPIAKATLPVNGEPKVIQFQPHNNYNASVGASYIIYDCTVILWHYLLAKSDCCAARPVGIDSRKWQNYC